MKHASTDVFSKKKVCSLLASKDVLFFEEQGWFTWTMLVQHCTQRHRWRMLLQILCLMSTGILVSLNLGLLFTRVFFPLIAITLSVYKRMQLRDLCKSNELNFDQVYR